MPAKRKAAAPLRTLAKLGGFAPEPRAPHEAKLAKWIALIGPARDAMVPKLAELPTTIHRRRTSCTATAPIALKFADSTLVLIEGDLRAPSISIDADEDSVVFVTGSIVTPFLMTTFPASLVVAGALTADYILHDTSGGLAVAGTTTAKKIFLFGDYNKPKLGKQPKGVVHTCYDQTIIRDVEPQVLWKRMLTGKRFLFE